MSALADLVTILTDNPGAFVFITLTVGAGCSVYKLILGAVAAWFKPRIVADEIAADWFLDRDQHPHDDRLAIYATRDLMGVGR